MEPVGAGLRPRPVWRGGRWRICRGRPACRPVGGSRAEAFPGGHIGPPLRGVEGVWEPAGIGAGRKSSPAGRGGARPLRGERSRAVRPAAGCAWGVASASQIPFRNLGRQSRSPRPTGATLVVRSSGPMWASAPTDRRGSRIDHPGQRRTAERLRRGREGWVEIGAWIIPKGASNAGQSLSRPPGDSSLYTREPWGRGNPSFFRKETAG